MTMTLGQLLLKHTAGGWPEGAPEPVVSGVAIDSREVKPGDVFFAFKGERVDGSDYVEEAFSRRAVAAVVQVEANSTCARPVCPAGGDGLLIAVPDVSAALQSWAADWRAQMPARVVAVTGSVGKTLTRDVIATVLSQRHRVHRAGKNYNNEIGLPLTLLGLREEHELAVLEMGMYALGEIADLVCLAKPEVGVVTNVGPTHLERLGSLDRIAQAKSELVRGLPADGLAVLNGDDPRVVAMAEASPCPYVTYGFGAGRDYAASTWRSLGLQGSEFDLRAEGRVQQVRSPLLGRAAVYAVLASVAVARHLGLSWEQIEAGIAEVGSCSRMKVRKGAEHLILDDTYNAAPASVLGALEILGEQEGRRVAVLGDMLELGEYSESGHREVGREVPTHADLLVAVGSRARLMASEARTAGMPPETVLEADTVEGAIEALADLVRPGDVFLIKGSRGMRMERICEALLAPSAETSVG